MADDQTRMWVEPDPSGFDRWPLRPNGEVLEAAIAGSVPASNEACRRGLGPDLVRELRALIPPAPPALPVPDEAPECARDSCPVWDGGDECGGCWIDDRRAAAPPQPDGPQPDTAELRGLGSLLRIEGYHKGGTLADAAAADLDRLRCWKAEATVVITQWEDVHDALGKPARLGESKAVASLAEVQRRATGSRPARVQPRTVVLDRHDLDGIRDDLEAGKPYDALATVERWLDAIAATPDTGTGES